MEFLPRRKHPDHVTVIGAGKFGSAIAQVISKDGTPTTLVTRSQSRLDTLRQRMAKRPPSLHIQTLERVRLGEHVFLALPSSDFPEVVARLALSDHASSQRSYTTLSKGLAEPDGSTPLEIVTSAFGADRCAVASGPSLAAEMTRFPTGLVVAATNEQLRTDVASLLASPTTSCELSDDPHGIEFAGIAKNIATLGFHACHRATGSLNIAGMYTSRLFGEVCNYAQTLGATPMSFIGTAGVGDLMTTSHANTSRNVQAGRLLGDRADLSTSVIEAKVEQVVESLHTVPLLIRRIDSETPDSRIPAIRMLGARITGDISQPEWSRRLLYGQSTE